MDLIYLLDITSSVTMDFASFYLYPTTVVKDALAYSLNVKCLCN